MQRFVLFLVVASLLIGIHSPAPAESWSQDQRAVLAAMDRLSAATAPDGLGIAAYEAVLDKNYNRWTTGTSNLQGRRAWIEGLTEWLGAGWRVVEQNQTVLDISIKGDYAFTRRIVEETYLGPEGETSRAKSALVEIWVGKEKAWLLRHVNVDVIEVTETPAAEPEYTAPQTVMLPPPLARVLTDYEEAWKAKDEKALAALFTEDGFVLSSGRPPVRGRDAIEERYRDSGGPLSLRAWAFSTEGSVGVIIGGYGHEDGGPDAGKFTLTLRKAPGGHWLIASDMDNGNR